MVKARTARGKFKLQIMKKARDTSQKREALGGLGKEANSKSIGFAPANYSRAYGAPRTVTPNIVPQQGDQGFKQAFSTFIKDYRAEQKQSMRSVEDKLKEIRAESKNQTDAVFSAFSFTPQQKRLAMKVVDKNLDLEERHEAKAQLNDSLAKRRDKFYLNDPETTAFRAPKPKKDDDVVMDAPTPAEEAAENIRKSNEAEKDRSDYLQSGVDMTDAPPIPPLPKDSDVGIVGQDDPMSVIDVPKQPVADPSPKIQPQPMDMVVRAPRDLTVDTDEQRNRAIKRMVESEDDRFEKYHRGDIVTGAEVEEKPQGEILERGKKRAVDVPVKERVAAIERISRKDHAYTPEQMQQIRDDQE